MKNFSGNLLYRLRLREFNVAIRVTHMNSTDGRGATSKCSLETCHRNFDLPNGMDPRFGSSMTCSRSLILDVGTDWDSHCHTLDAFVNQFRAIGFLCENSG